MRYATSFCLFALSGCALSGCGHTGPQAADLDKLAMPDDMIGWARLDSPRKSVDEVNAFIHEFVPTNPALWETLVEDLGGEDVDSQLFKLAAAAKPAIVFLFGDLDDGDPQHVVVVQLEKPEQGLTALEGKWREEGPLLHWIHPSRYVMELGGGAFAISKYKALLLKHGDLLGRFAVSDYPKAMVAVFNARSIVGKFEVGWDQLAKIMDKSQPGLGQGFVTLWKELLGQADRFLLVGEVAAKDGVLLDLTLVAKDDTWLAGALDRGAPAPMKELSQAPRDAPLLASFGFGAESQSLWTRFADVAFSPKATSDDRTAAKQLILDMLKIMSGGLMAVHGQDGQVGLQLSGAYLTPDAQQMKTIMRKWWTVNGKVMFAGIRVETKNDAYTIDGVSVDVTETQLGEEQTGPIMGQMMAFMKDLLKWHFAYVNQRAFFTMGASGQATLTEWIRGKWRGADMESPSLKRAVAKMLPGASMWIWASPVGLLQRMHLGGFNVFARMFQSVDPGLGVSGSMAVAAGALTMRMDIPLATVLPWLRKFQGGMNF